MRFSLREVWEKVELLIYTHTLLKREREKRDMFQMLKTMGHFAWDSSVFFYLCLTNGNCYWRSLDGNQRWKKKKEESKREMKKEKQYLDPLPAPPP